MVDPVTLAAIFAGLKGLGGLFGSRSRNAQYDANRDATIASLTLRQKMSEDQRRARLALAMGLLGGVPETTAGGGVRTNLDLDPALIADLDKERTYDFGAAVPERAGGLDAFLSGLFGTAGDTVGAMKPSPSAAPTVPTGAAASPTGASPFDDPTFNLPNPTVTFDDLDDFDDED